MGRREGRDISIAGAVASRFWPQPPPFAKTQPPAIHARTCAGGRASNPLRFKAIYRVDQPTFDALKALQSHPGVAGDVGMRSDSGGEWGSRLPAPAGGSPTIVVGGRTYELSDKPGAFTELNPEDLRAITRNIADAKARSKYVFFYIHTHESGAPLPPIPALGRTSTPAPFIVEFAHKAIDAGVDVFFANGSHILRGIEIYKGKPILYGLGDFFLQNDLTRVLPTDFYNRYRLGPDALPSEAMTARNSYNDPELYEPRRRAHLLPGWRAARDRADADSTTCEKAWHRQFRCARNR